MAWFYLMMAILLEVLGTTSMKLSEGFTKVVPSVAMFFFYGLSFSALTLALKKLEVGLAYAVWGGLGTVLITLIGIAYFNESTSLLKLVSIGLIVVGVVGLNLSGGVH